MRKGARDASHSDVTAADILSVQVTSQRRQQVAEALRNKGIICEDFLTSGSCPRSPFCPYMHIRNGETRPLPWSVCAFFNQGVCLRDRCTFFHGSQEQLNALRTRKVKTYQPQEYMVIARPPREFLTEDGNLSTQVTNEQLERARTGKSNAAPQSQIVPFRAPPMLPAAPAQRPVYVLPAQAAPGQTVMINASMQMVPTAPYTSVANYTYMAQPTALPMIISTTDGSFSNGGSISLGTQSSGPSYNPYPQVSQFTQALQPTYHFYRLQ